MDGPDGDDYRLVTLTWSKANPKMKAKQKGKKFAGFYFYDAPKRPLATGGMQAQLWGFRIVCLPYWALTVASAMPPSLWVVNRRRCRREPGHCPRCGYDLRATLGRCPEMFSLP